MGMRGCREVLLHTPSLIVFKQIGERDE